MNKIIKYAIISIFIIITSLNGEESDQLEIIRSLLDDATQQITAQKGFSTLSRFLNNFRGHEKYTKFHELLKSMDENWKLAVLNLDYIAPSDIKKAVLLCSCSNIQKQDYIELLTIATQLTEEGKLNPDIYFDIRCPIYERSNAWAVLAKNYKDPSVIDIVMRSKIIFKDHPERITYYDRILSGESCKGIYEYERKMYGKINPFNNQKSVEKNDESLIQQDKSEKSESEIIHKKNLLKYKTNVSVVVCSVFCVIILIVVMLFLIKKNHTTQ